jgi:hypothetical protein
VGNYKDAVTKRTSIGVKSSTKNKLDKNRAPGQCYDGFINQLVDLWETTKIEVAKKSKG